MGRFFLNSVFLYFLLLTISCQEVEELPEVNEPDLIEFIEGEGLFIFAQILKDYPNIIAAIDEQEEYTIFAPTDEAFERAFMAARVDNLEAFIKRIGGDEYLEIYIKHHILSYALHYNRGQTYQNTVPLSGVLLLFNVHTGYPVLMDLDANEVNFLKRDLQFNTNVVHIIDNVVWPIFTMGKKGSELELIACISSFLSFEFIASIISIPNLKSELDDHPGMSVFLPGNAAFDRLYEKFNVNNLEELIIKIGMDNFKSIILYHIVPDMVWFTTNGDHVFKGTNEQEFTVNRNGDVITLIDAQGNKSNLSRSVFDAEFKNGVFHPISEVMIPELDMPIPQD